MIPAITDQIDPMIVVVLMNAVYFKGVWAIKFDEAHSARGTFTLSKRGPQPCAMMTHTDKKMLYSEADGMQVVELPYGTTDGRFVATVMLPPDIEGALADFVSQFSSSDGAALLVKKISSLQPKHVKLQLPRFKIEFGAHDLKPELQSTFGMIDTVNGRGQFLAMSSDRDVHLSSVLHKVVVEVNEEGSKAAAVTGSIMISRAAISALAPPKEVIVNRLFLFLIRDSVTEMHLFAGIVQDPELDTTGV